MKKIVFVMLAIGVLTGCGSAGNYCASTDENNNQEITPQENQHVVVVDNNTEVSPFI
ncbi:MAG TPA: hypothetical protein VK021_10395 [Flavobacteriaceae bacterium]|nr:hypothetical protein [Flavobacteriaceae bacterium]